MQPLMDPRLRALKPIGKSNESQNRHRKVAGNVKRLRRSNIWNRVIELGAMSDAVVVQNKNAETKSLRELVEHEQKFTGALDRLRRQYSFSMKIPAKVELAILASAFKSTGERK